MTKIPFSHRWKTALRLLIAGAAAVACPVLHAGEASKSLPEKPNILYIAIDDLRDWAHYLGCEQVKTPNMDRLAARGEYFTRNYCAAPVCNPSRTALITGRRPSTTGVYTNMIDWRKVPAATSVPSIPVYFRQNGYVAYAAGKIYHESFRKADEWDEYADLILSKNLPSAVESKGVKSIRFRPLTCGDEEMPDYKSVSYCLEQLKKAHDKPLFLACGIYKPHMPWEVPQKYYDMYPIESIQLPRVKEDDLADIPPTGVAMAHKGADHAAILKSGRWKEAVQGYLAAITFADAMLGRLLDGFDRSAFKDNTIIVLWSDHGWHLGEKEHWKKFALWEESTRSPLIWVVPGLTKPGSVCGRTIDLMDVYPTLCDLAGLPIPAHVEGQSIRPLLQNPNAPWDRPAITTHEFNNHSVRTEKWRYIRYADGGEELYDHDKDPLEWINLAPDPQFSSVKEDLQKWLPKTNALLAKEAKAKSGKGNAESD